MWGCLPLIGFWKSARFGDINGRGFRNRFCVFVSVVLLVVVFVLMCFVCE